MARRMIGGEPAGIMSPLSGLEILARHDKACGVLGDEDYHGYVEVWRSTGPKLPERQGALGAAGESARSIAARSASGLSVPELLRLQKLSV